MKLQLTGHKLLYHLDVLLKWKNNEMFPPLFIEFGPTNICNHRCRHCYVQDITEKPTTMKEDVYLRVMEEVGKYGVKAVLLGGCGEPMLHKFTPEAIKTAVENGTDVGMLSNGVPINDKSIPVLMDNLTFIRLTINGYSEKSYKMVHQCPPEDWIRLKLNMKKLADYKRKHNSDCTLGVYTLLYEEAISELEDWTREIKDMGFDYIIIKPPERGLGNIRYVEPIRLEKCKSVFERVLEISNSNFKVQIRKDLFAEGCVKKYERCLGLPFACMFDADGSVCACNWFWGKEDFVYGNLNKNTFPEIWEGKRKAKILERVQSKDFDLSKCGTCKQNVINGFLWELVNPPDHVNFI